MPFSGDHDAADMVALATAQAAGQRVGPAGVQQVSMGVTMDGKLHLDEKREELGGGVVGPALWLSYTFLGLFCWTAWRTGRTDRVHGYADDAEGAVREGKRQAGIMAGVE